MIIGPEDDHPDAKMIIFGRTSIFGRGMIAFAAADAATHAVQFSPE